MTLEEAIEYYKHLEESQMRVYEKYPSSSGKEVAEHFAQLVEWLKELHAYRKERGSAG